VQVLTAGDREELASAALARVDALHTGLTQIVLEGGNLDDLAAEVARVLGVGVVFTSTDGRERAAALGEDHRALLADDDLLDPTGRVRVERIHGDVGHVSRVAAGGADLARLVAVRPGEPLRDDD